MKLFLDTADLSLVEKYLAWGVIDGVTTNPSIMVKCGAKTMQAMIDRAKELAGMIDPRPLSVEVITDDVHEMVKQGLQWSSLAGNIAVKVPITTTKGEPCLRAVAALSDTGTAVNVTAMMTFNQLMLAAKAGGRYLSLFGGRIDDEGADATRVIRDCRRWLNYQLDLGPNDEDPEIIVGSTRTVKNVEDWALAGAHIITVTPDVLAKLAVNARTKETVAQFLADGTVALGGTIPCPLVGTR